MAVILTAAAARRCRPTVPCYFRIIGTSTSLLSYSSSPPQAHSLLSNWLLCYRSKYKFTDPPHFPKRYRVYAKGNSTHFSEGNYLNRILTKFSKYVPPDDDDANVVKNANEMLLEYFKIVFKFGLHSMYDTCTMNLLIGAYARLGYVHTGGFNVFAVFIQIGNFGDVHTFSSLLNGMLIVKDYSGAELFYSKVMEYNLCKPNTKFFSIAIKGLCLSFKVDKAMCLLNQMENHEGCTPNVITYTPIFLCLLQQKQVKRMWELYENMRHEKHIPPTKVFYAIIVTCFATMGRLYDVDKMLQDMLKWDALECKKLVRKLHKDEKITPSTYAKWLDVLP
ncbi:hypothetical protein CTI12_AA097180 [Artemisia annua]|uniref:Pentatricopeptide repeat-containing protein n=1 Tax=Artemisia annua TaxID=35608 RepID=A0A2U1PKQ3_ARTAN|nr:hypothetical protein CTI12_AA097180 [Artemisia annua]